MVRCPRCQQEFELAGSRAFEAAVAEAHLTGEMQCPFCMVTYKLRWSSSVQTAATTNWPLSAFQRQADSLEQESIRLYKEAHL